MLTTATNSSLLGGRLITANAEFMSPEEVGERLGLSVYTVRRWIQEGKLRAFKPGKEYRIRETDLEEFLQTREVRPRAPRPSPYESSLLDGLDEERRAQWDAAVLSARLLRERGRARMAELLAAWHESKDRDYLSQMAELLQKAYDAETALLENMQAGLDIGTHLGGDKPALEEVRAASHFYGALREMVEGAGLHVRREAEAHEVKNAA
jgi:excisionase family DNA binding protein